MKVKLLRFVFNASKVFLELLDTNLNMVSYFLCYVYDILVLFFMILRKFLLIKMKYMFNVDILLYIGPIWRLSTNILYATVICTKNDLIGRYTISHPYYNI